MKRHNFKKSLGQNFLNSSRFIFELIDPLDLSEDDLVIEIGPGDGAVTRRLLETGANVICIEKDYDLLPKLIQKFKDFDNFDLVHFDVMKVNLTEMLVQNFGDQPFFNVKITGSLPYNISKKIIKKFLKINNNDDRIQVDVMSFIVQNEVAKQIVAKPPKATYLSNYLKVYAEIKKSKTIPASQFTPRPKVDGGIIVLYPKEGIQNAESINKLLKVGFASPRKTLLNNLKSNKDFKSLKLTELLNKANISERARPAEVEFDQWLKLSELIARS